MGTITNKRKEQKFFKVQISCLCNRSSSNGVRIKNSTLLCGCSTIPRHWSTKNFFFSLLGPVGEYLFHLPNQTPLLRHEILGEYLFHLPNQTPLLRHEIFNLHFNNLILAGITILELKKGKIAIEISKFNKSTNSVSESILGFSD